MTIKPSIFWHQGLFLEPHHFQHLDQRVDGLVARTHQAQQPWAWGLLDVQLDHSALQAHVLGLERVLVCWREGTLCEFPGNARVETRRFELNDFAQRPRTAYLGIRRAAHYEANVLRFQTPQAMASSSTRFAALDEPQDLADHYEGQAPAKATLVEYVLRLFWDDEIHSLDDYELIPLVCLEQHGDSVRVVENFIPPVMSLGASSTLLLQLESLRDEIIGRARQLEVYKQPLAKQEGESYTQFVAILALSVLNRYGVQLKHLLEGEKAHPWQLYGVLCQLVAELSSFSEYCDLLGETADNQSLMSAYDHEQLGPVFTRLNDLLLRLLNEITMGPELFMRLVSSPEAPTVYHADLPAHFFGPRHRFYLLVRSSLDIEAVRSRLLLEGKLISPDKLDSIISRALPGIELIAMDTTPLGVPKRSDSVCFRIESQSLLWEEVQADGRLALFLPYPPEDFKAELIVLKG